MKLLPYSEVKDRIVRNFHALKPEIVSVDKSVGRISAQDAVSKKDIPSQNVSAMDGYAIISSETKRASVANPARFDIKGFIYPSDSTKNKRNRFSVSSSETYYVATGAPVPAGADAVVKVEDTRLAGKQIVIAKGIPKAKNLSAVGEDVASGQLLLKKFEIVTPAKLALLMQCGIYSIQSFRIPRVRILSIGDELTLISQRVKEKTVNNYAHLILGYLSGLGACGNIIGIANDDQVEIRKIILREVKKYDMLITIGGTSVGIKDYTIDALTGDGSEILFHGVRIVPIRPAGLGIVSGKPVVVLPSHAVSSTLSFFLVGIPVLNIISGLSFESRQPKIAAYASEELSNTRYLDALHLVELEVDDNGHFKATALSWGSNLISNLARAHGFVQMKPNQVVKKGEMMIVRLLGHSALSSF